VPVSFLCKTAFDPLQRPTRRWFSSDIARSINLLTYLLKMTYT